MKLSEKQTKIMEVLKDFQEKEGKGANSYNLIELYKDVLEANKINTERINSVNATLASLATKGLVKKSKELYNGKLITKYTLEEVEA